MSLRHSSPALLLLSLFACDRYASGGAASGAVRDSAGIAIVENASPAWTAAEAWMVSAQPTLAMGASEGDPDHEFFQVSAATRLSDGTIVVANSGTQQLRYYGPDGALVRSVGRKGGGPGEFQMLVAALRLPGDSLLTVDGMNRRMSLFDPSGRHVRDFGVTDASNPVPLLVQGYLPGGAYLARATNMRIGPAMFERKPGPTRDSLFVLRLDAAGVPVDTFGLFPGPRSEVQMLEFGGRSMPMPIMIPFSGTTHIAAAGGRVYVGVSDTYEIRTYTPAGELSMLIRRAHEPRPVTEHEIAETRTRLMEVIESQSNPLMAQFREAYEKISYPETMPAFGNLVADRDGNLWVSEPVALTENPRRWSVFDRNGVWLGDVTTPARLNVQEIGSNYILGNATDDLDVEQVLLYALVKPKP